MATAGFFGMILLPESNTGMTSGQMVISALAIGWFGISYYKAAPTPARNQDTEHHHPNREFDRDRVRAPALALGVVLIFQAPTGYFRTASQVTLTTALAVTGFCLLVLAIKRPPKPRGAPASLLLASLGGVVIALGDYAWAWNELSKNWLAAIAVAATATGVLMFALGLGAIRPHYKSQPPRGRSVVGLNESSFILSDDRRVRDAG